MSVGKMMDNLRTAGIVVAALAAVLLVGHPAAAAPAQGAGATRSATSGLKAEGNAGARAVPADRSCTVSNTNPWTCMTATLWVDSGANPHIATLNIPWSAPYDPTIDWDPINSFVIARYLDPPGTQEMVHDNKWHGNEHNIWSVGWPAGNYRAELHCPYGCAGATLYFDN